MQRNEHSQDSSPSMLDKLTTLLKRLLQDRSSRLKPLGESFTFAEFSVCQADAALAQILFVTAQKYFFSPAHCCINQSSHPMRWS